MENCPLCDNKSKMCGQDPQDRIFQVNCKTCGLYFITDDAKEALVSKDIKSQRIKISTFIKERQIKKLPTLTLFYKENEQTQIQPRITLNDAIKQFPDKFSDRVDKALLNLSNLSKHTGDKVQITPATGYYSLYVDSLNMGSIEFMVHSLSDLGFVNRKGLQGGYVLSLTQKGWNHIYELEKKSNINSNQVFVAMWFDDSMSSAWENGFKKGIEDAGYTPVRVDNVEHNNKICDEIIAEIRKSRFIISDFTGQRGGVYFEAGFGLGLGLQVIWTCKADSVEELHFDTRQYSHVLWEDEEELRVKLKNRILATIV
jgi:hypothetical protein